MNKSYWINSAKGKEYPSLSADYNCDCTIIGGGITGLTTAYILAKMGKKVVLVDANNIGYGCTGRNTGKITALHNVIYYKIKNKYSIQDAKNYYDGNTEAIQFVEDLVKVNNIDCDFKRTKAYTYAQTDKGLKELQKEYRACIETGIDCEYLEEISIPIKIKGAIAFKNQAEFNPKKYCDAIAELFIKEGGTIYENTPIVEVKEGEECLVTSRDGKSIKSKNLILASHFPFYDGESFFFTRLKPERSYIVAGSPSKELPEGMYVSNDEPRRSIHYIKEEKENILLIGGENHKVGQGEDIDYYEVLKKYGEENLGVKNYSYQWSAEDYITPDYIPYIGRLNNDSRNVYVGTGFGKWGMTSGTLAGIIISDLILNGKSKYEKTFNPSRFKTYFSADFIKENLNVAKELVKGKLNMGEINPDIKKGDAEIILIDGDRYGAYRDMDNNLHIIDITCTHLGCELSWNDIERSWDCPCHGSRFDCEGNVLDGPATEKLKRYGEGENKINPKFIKK